MEIFIAIGLVILGFCIGWFLREQVAIQQVKRIIDEITLEEIEQEYDNVIRITIEKDSDMLFAYHKENSQFIAQGSTQAELETKLSELFPGKKFGVTSENISEIGFKL